MGEFPSGQRGQTVNLLRIASMVRIRPPPPQTANTLGCWLFCFISIIDSFKILPGPHSTFVRATFSVPYKSLGGILYGSFENWKQNSKPRKALYYFPLDYAIL